MFGIFSRKKSILESGLLDGFTDHHSHLLPGVDDGFQTADLTLEALRTMEQAGVADVWLTPHIMEDVPNTVGALKQRFEEFSATYNGCYSKHTKEKAEWLLENGYYDLMGSDIHNLRFYNHTINEPLPKKVIEAMRQIPNQL